jgi:hypothetical protein
MVGERVGVFHVATQCLDDLCRDTSIILKIGALAALVRRLRRKKRSEGESGTVNTTVRLRADVT